MSRKSKTIWRNAIVAEFILVNLMKYHAIKFKLHFLPIKRQRSLYNGKEYHNLSSLLALQIQSRQKGKATRIAKPSKTKKEEVKINTDKFYHERAPKSSYNFLCCYCGLSAKTILENNFHKSYCDNLNLSFRSSEIMGV